jgi:hypothetical protein
MRGLRLRSSYYPMSLVRNFELTQNPKPYDFFCPEFHLTFFPGFGNVCPPIARWV